MRVIYFDHSATTPVNPVVALIEKFNGCIF